MRLETVLVASVGGREHAGWAEGRTVTLPAAWIARAGWRRFMAAGSLTLPADTDAVDVDLDVVALREHAAFTDRPPASARLPVPYHYVPAAARTMIASALGRWNRGRADRWARFPSWPLDLSADFLADIGLSSAPLQTKTPVILTHDIDSPEGLSRLVDDFLPLEEAAAARSTSYVVPCAWPIDHGRLDQVVERGHDIGVHGYDHGNRTPFASDDERRRRLDGADALVERYGIAGYRAPSLLRTRPLLRDLRSRYRYDSSIPTSGGLFPVPNNGCASARPFTIEGILELPLSLPRDGSLRFLGYSAPEIARLWIECAETVSRARGVVVLLTHCERRFSGNGPMLSAYASFLEHIRTADDRFVFSMPRAALGLTPESAGQASTPH
jgi:peptidoglycan/xylan/chitin deacetylase (PgdA/CDA1 family)